jgi:hypothetical protein
MNFFKINFLRRDTERSPLFLGLQTPSPVRVLGKGDERGVVGSEKHFRNFKYSYEGKLFLHMCKLEWFKSKQI